MILRSILKSAWVVKYLSLLLALQVFNCSVDPPDREADGTPEDLNFNDMESVVEIVLENVFGINNAMPEHDEPDHQGGGFSWKLAMDPTFAPASYIATLWNSTAEQRVGAPVAKEWEGRYRPQPTAPPPKA